MSPLATYYLLSIITLGVCGAAIWKGGPAERRGALVILCIVIVQRLGLALASDDYSSAIMLAGDALTAVGLLLLTIRYASLWLGGCMICYAATFVLHAFYIVTERPEGGMAWIWVNDICFAAIHICLVLGTAMSWRRRMAERQLAMAAA